MTMAGFKTDDDSDLIGDINVTPFVDVVLVLLIIFMSTSTVIIRTALDLDIPVAGNADQKDEPPILSIHLTDEDTVELNGEPTSREALRDRLEREVRDRKRPGGGRDAQAVQALISAGGAHPYQAVVDLIDLVKGTGVNTIALNTKMPNPADSREGSKERP
jgi:biopolymer transport protein ExbD